MLNILHINLTRYEDSNVIGVIAYNDESMEFKISGKKVKILLPLFELNGITKNSIYFLIDQVILQLQYLEKKEAYKNRDLFLEMTNLMNGTITVSKQKEISIDMSDFDNWFELYVIKNNRQDKIDNIID